MVAGGDAMTTTPVESPAADTRGMTLWDHQRQAVELARPRKGFLLAHAMGTGKSATAIALLDDDEAMRVLVLCPKSVVDVWPTQLKRHSDRSWLVWSGTVIGARGPLKNPSVPRRAVAVVEATMRAIARSQPLAVIVNYEAAHQGDMADILLGTHWDAVILDESHRIKAPGGKASKFAAKVCARTRSRDGRVLALTGTPMPHSPLDLFGQLRALDGGKRLGTSYHRFCHAFGAGEQIYAAGGVPRTVFKDIRVDRVDAFTELIAPIMHRCEADEVLDLPEVLHVTRTIHLDPATRKVYDDLERHLIADIKGGVVTSANAMVSVLRLAQITSGFARNADTGIEQALATPPEKGRLLADAFEDLPIREPVVVFCRFRHDLDVVRQLTESSGRRYGELSGRRRDGLTDHATMNPDIDVLGCQLASGGVGIDLTRARIAVYFSLDFKLADFAQSQARLHRPGQTRPVTFVHLLAADTVDYAIYGALRRRQEVIDTLINHLRGEATP